MSAFFLGRVVRWISAWRKVGDTANSYGYFTRKSEAIGGNSSHACAQAMNKCTNNSVGLSIDIYIPGARDSVVG
jgi:hypothetical protein